MTPSAVEPLQHPLQLCILHLKLARQLVPEKPDLFSEIDCIVRIGGTLGDGGRTTAIVFAFLPRMMRFRV